MSEQPKKSGLREKMKNTKINRATVITVVMLVIAITVIVSVTVATNRSKKKNELPDNTDKGAVSDTAGTDNKIPPLPNDTNNSPDTSAPTTSKPQNGASQVENKLPSFILPVSGALSKKHDTDIQVYSNTLNDYRVHVGLDIVTAENAPVYAAADGTISKIWSDPMMGYCIAVKHSGNCLTVYKNLSETLPDGITEGTAVRSGQLIASVGESALMEIAEEPHLHFEMTVDDLSVDPLEYFNEKALEALSIDASHGE